MSLRECDASRDPCAEQWGNQGGTGGEQVLHAGESGGNRQGGRNEGNQGGGNKGQRWSARMYERRPNGILVSQYRLYGKRSTNPELHGANSLDLSGCMYVCLTLVEEKSIHRKLCTS